FSRDWSSDVCSSDLLHKIPGTTQTSTSRQYVLNLSGSRYFVERAPIGDYEELDRRMRSGELSMALEIPPGFARDLQRGRPVAIGGRKSDGQGDSADH